MGDELTVQLHIDNSAMTEFLTGPSGPVYADLTRRVLKVHAAAVRSCPVDTGRLRSSLRWTIGKDAKGLVGIVGTDVSYAGYVNDGTRYFPGTHFLTDALKEAIN